VTVNNLWILAWLGNYDKLAMSRRILSAHYDLDIDRDPEQVLYAGDSTNDAPMFAISPRYRSHPTGSRQALAGPGLWKSPTP